MTGPIAKGTIRTSAVLGLRLAVQAGTLLLVARMLGPRQFGAFAGVAALAVVLGTLSTFGTHIVLLSEVSKNPAHRQGVLLYAIPTTLLCGGALLLAYLLICSSMLSEAAIAPPVLVAIGLAEIILQPLLMLPTSEHMGLGRIARSQLLRTSPLALRLGAAATVFALHLEHPLSAYAFGYLCASAVALVTATRTLPESLPQLRTWRLPSRHELRESIGYAVLNITTTTPAEFDKTLAARLLPLGTAGLYAVAARTIGATTLPVMAMMFSALPRLFRAGTEKPEHTARLLRWIFATAMGYGMILAIVLWLAAPMVVWLFGTKYDGVQHMIHWLCLAVPGLTLRISAGNVLMAFGKPWMRIGFELAGLAVLSAAAFFLTTRLGAIGMPLALTCSEWTMVAIGAWFVVRAQRGKSMVQQHC